MSIIGRCSVLTAVARKPPQAASLCLHCRRQHAEHNLGLHQRSQSTTRAGPEWRGHGDGTWAVHDLPHVRRKLTFRIINLVEIDVVRLQCSTETQVFYAKSTPCLKKEFQKLRLLRFIYLQVVLVWELWVHCQKKSIFLLSNQDLENTI